eukprot:gene18102-90_t
MDGWTDPLTDATEVRSGKVRWLLVSAHAPKAVEHNLTEDFFATPAGYKRPLGDRL